MTKTLPTQSTRIEYLDFIKFIAIYFVVWGHVTQYGIKDAVDSGLWHPASEFIVSFHMPLFMLLSGIFAGSSLKLSLGGLLKKKSLQLLLPAFVWTACALVILFARGKNPFEIYNFQAWMGDYWFLKCLFICYLLFYVSMKLFRKDVWAAAASILLLPQGSFLWINVMLPFFWLGYFLKSHLMQAKIGRKVFFAATAVFVLLLLEWNIKEYSIYTTPIKLIDYKQLSFDLRNFYVMLFRFVLGLTGSISIIYLCKTIYEKFRHTRWVKLLSVYGRETLGIYLAQQIVIVFLANLYAFPQTINIYVFDFLAAQIYNILTIIISLFIIRIFDKYKVTRVLFLGK